MIERALTSASRDPPHNWCPVSFFLSEAYADYCLVSSVCDVGAVRIAVCNMTDRAEVWKRCAAVSGFSDLSVELVG
jgi:hypothetical protein